MKAIVIGGGIGGPVAAVALRRAGIEAVVLEAGEGVADHRGLFLGLGINGMRVLRGLGLLDGVMRADVIPTPTMVFSSWTGKRLGVISNGWLDSQTPSITIMRGALQRALADGAQAAGVEIHYGKRFVTATDSGRGVAATFEDGTEMEGDILIGADGIRSRVRSAMDPQAPGPGYTGLLNIGGMVENAGLPATPNEMHMMWGQRAFFGYTVRENGQAWWFANLGERREPARDALAAVSSAEWRQRLRAQFAGDPAFVTSVIDRTEWIGAYPIHDMPSLPSWRRGRIALLGDAAHAVSPSAGQGASMAMEDAVVLAKALRDIESRERALARYESIRRPRAERIVAVGRRNSAYKAPKTRVTRVLRDLFMPLGFRMFASEKAMSWVFDHEIRWDERVDA